MKKEVNTLSWVMLLTLAMIFSFFAGLIGSAMITFSFFVCGVTMRIFLRANKNYLALAIMVVSFLGMALSFLVHYPEKFFLPIPKGIQPDQASILTAVILIIIGMMMPSLLVFKTRRGIGWSDGQ
jgi:hypothetical protein